MRKTSVTFLAVILFVALNTKLTFAQSTTIVVPDDFSTIQEAVNAAKSGDTIFVKAGLYQENVTIKTNDLTLTGENKHTTVIDGSGGNGRTIMVDKADYVKISGFTVQNTHDGVFLYESSFSTVSGNFITTCASRGIILSVCSFVTISGNTLTSNHDGVELYRSSFVKVSANTIKNSRLSIGTSQSFNNTFSENTITKSQIGIYIWNCSYTTASGNKIANNTENGISLVYSSYCRFSGNTIINSASRGISLGNSDNCFVSENTVKFSAKQGIHLFYSSGHTVTENKLTSNYVGLGLYMTSYATVFENTMSNCRTGLTVVQANDNIFYHNSIIDNQYQAAVENSTDVWDDGYPSGGNYWSDYNGTDVDGDGIGDVPYLIAENNQDNYPLMSSNGANQSILYTLIVDSLPSGVTFTANDTSYAAPWLETFANSTILNLEMPQSYFYEGKNYTWSQWSDKNTNKTRTVTLTENISLTAVYTSENTSVTVSILSPENKTYTTNEISLQLTTNQVFYRGSYSLDGQENVTIFSNKTLTGLSEGTHSIIVYAEDELGNITASEKVYFTVALPITGITILSPENTTYNIQEIALDYLVNETCASVVYSLDGQPEVDTQNVTILSGLVDGYHELTLIANFTGSTMSESATVWFTVDTTAPNIAEVIHLPVVVNGSLEDGAKVNATVTDTGSGIKWVGLNYADDNGTWVTTEMTLVEGKIWTGNIPGFPHGTNITYVITAEDFAGNIITSEDLIGQPNQYQVLPEFPSWLMLPLLLAASLVVTVYKKRLSKKANPPLH